MNVGVKNSILLLFGLGHNTFSFVCHVGFYVAYLVIRGMRVILLLTADTFLHYSRRRVSSD